MSAYLGKFLVSSMAILATGTQSIAGGYGANCYERIDRPAVYDTIRETMMVDPGSKQVEIIPPVYGTRERKVMVRPATERWEVVPAKYAYQKEKVLVSPARTVARVIPAVTDVVHKKVLVSEGGYTWEWRIIKGRKVLCKIKQPPVYRTLAKHVVIQPERVVRETIPAQWGYETRKVMVSPPRKER